MEGSDGSFPEYKQGFSILRFCPHGTRNTAEINALIGFETAASGEWPSDSTRQRETSAEFGAKDSGKSNGRTCPT